MDYITSKLFGLSNKKKLADILKVDKRKLKDINKEFQPYKLPSELSIVNGKIRDLFNPSNEHKRALKILVNLLMQVNIPEYVYGGIKQKSHIQNAAMHHNQKFLMLIDIQNFFPSTRDFYVYNLFKNKFHMSEDIAKILTDFVTIPTEKNIEQRYLPQGFPTSPILSFLAYEDMYKELHKISIENKMHFSCYYDDLTFSSNKFIDKKVKRKCANIIKNYGFNIHPKKSKLILKKGIVVTGVFLNEINELKAPKKLLKKLQFSYETVKFMDDNPELYTKLNFINELNRLQGLIAAVKSIEENRKVELFLNELKYIRKKYDVPYKKENIKLHFKTDKGMLVK